MSKRTPIALDSPNRRTGARTKRETATTDIAGKLAPNKIQHTKLGKTAADHLRREILEGRLRPGDALPSEIELMALFGISRPTLREAIRILENLGLVTVYRGKKGGAEVTHPEMTVTANNAAIYLQANGATFLELSQARGCIEPELILLLEGRIGPQDFKFMRETLDEAAASTDDAARYAHAITIFHGALFDLLGNRVLNLVAGVLNNVYEPMVARHLANYSAERRQSNLTINVSKQYRLLELMERGEFSAAADFCRQNLLRIGGVLVETGGATRVIDSESGVR